MGEGEDNKQISHVVCQMVSSSFEKTQAGKGSAQVPLCVQGERSRAGDVVILQGSVREGLTERLVRQDLMEVRGHSREREHKRRDSEEGSKAVFEEQQRGWCAWSEAGDWAERKK